MSLPRALQVYRDQAESVSSHGKMAPHPAVIGDDLLVCMMASEVHRKSAYPRGRKGWGRLLGETGGGEKMDALSLSPLIPTDSRMTHLLYDTSGVYH